MVDRSWQLHLSGVGLGLMTAIAPTLNLEIPYLVRFGGFLVAGGLFLLPWVPLVRGMLTRKYWRTQIKLRRWALVTAAVASMTVIAALLFFSTPAAVLKAPRPMRADIESQIPWFYIALGEVDVAEFAGPMNNPRIAAYIRSVQSAEVQEETIDWASAFVEWSLNQVGIDGPKDHNSFAWLNWGRTLKELEVGCIALLSPGGLRHVGFFVSERDGMITILGGNQDNKVSVRAYPKSQFHSCKMPAES